MNLGELIVDLSLDYAEFTQSLEQAKKAASTAAASIEKSFQKISLTIEVDDSALYDLNKHLDLKYRHFKEVNQYFKNNPLTPTVDDGELTELNKTLKELTQNKHTVTIEQRINAKLTDTSKRDISKSVTDGVADGVEKGVSKGLNGMEDMIANAVADGIKAGSKSFSGGGSGGSKGKQEGIEDIVDELKSGFGDLQKQIGNQLIGDALKTVLKPAKDLITGFSEGISNDLGQQISKGLQDTFAKQLGMDFKKMGEQAGNNLLGALGIKVKKENKVLTAISDGSQIAIKSLGKSVQAYAVSKLNKALTDSLDSIFSELFKGDFSAAAKQKATSTAQRAIAASKSAPPSTEAARPSRIIIPIDEEEKPTVVQAPLNIPVVKKPEKLPVVDIKPKTEKVLLENTFTPFEKAAHESNKNFGYVLNEIGNFKVKGSPVVGGNQTVKRVATEITKIKNAHQKAYSTFKNLLESAKDLGDYELVDQIYKDFIQNSQTAKSKIDILLKEGKEAGLKQHGYNKLATAKSGISRSVGKSSGSIPSKYQAVGRQAEGEAVAIGKNVVAGLGIGVDNKAFAKFGVDNATAYLLAIKKAFGIASPARNMIPIGVNILQGLILGVKQQLPLLSKLTEDIKFQFVKNLEFLKLSLPGQLNNLQFQANQKLGAAYLNLPRGVRNRFDPLGMGLNPIPDPSEANTVVQPLPAAQVLFNRAKQGVKSFVSESYGENTVVQPMSSSKVLMMKARDAISKLVGDNQYTALLFTAPVKNLFKSLFNTVGSVAGASLEIGEHQLRRGSANARGVGNFVSGVAGAYGEAINSSRSRLGEETLGIHLQALVKAVTHLSLNAFGVSGRMGGIGAIMGSLTSGNVSALISQMLPLLVPILGLKGLNLGDTIVKILNNNLAIKPGFLNDLFKSLTGIKLEKTGFMSAVTSTLGISKGSKSPITSTMEVISKQISQNLGSVGTGGSIPKLVENTGQMLVSAVLKQFGVSGAVGVAIEAMVKGRIANIANLPIFTNTGGKGIGGRVRGIAESYAQGDVDGVIGKSSKLTGTILRTIGFKVDMKQLTLVMGVAIAGITAFHKAFTEEGLGLGQALLKGFKEAQKNWGNAFDDMKIKAKQAMGMDVLGDMTGNIVKKIKQGTVVSRQAFSEFFDEIGKTFKNKALKGDKEGVFGNILGFGASISTMIAPITTMAASLLPLLIPLMPLMGALGGLAMMVGKHITGLANAIKEVEPLQRRLNFLGGSPAGGDREMKYAQGVANKYNTPVKEGIDAYSKLAIAARGTKLEGDGVKELYEGISASISALGLGTQDAGLVFMAYSQMLSKGKISMEELRQQLGERFPPAMGDFAKALGVSTAELGQLSQKGALLSEDVLPKVAKTLNQDYGKAAANSAGSFTVALTKLGNVGFDIAIKLTKAFGGTFAMFTNFGTGILGIFKDALDQIIPLFNSLMIGVTAVVGVGLSVILKANPIANFLVNMQTLITVGLGKLMVGLAPFYISIIADVADGWLGAQNDLMDNMMEGVGNMAVAMATALDNLNRTFTGQSLFSDFVGKNAGNPFQGMIDGLGSLFRIIPSGLVELGALVLMFQQVKVLAKTMLVPVGIDFFKGLGSILGNFAKMATPVKTIISELLVNTSDLFRGDALDKKFAKMRFGEQFGNTWKTGLAAIGNGLKLLTPLALEAALALGVILFARSDFSNPISDSIGKMATGINNAIKSINGSLDDLANKFDNAGKSAKDMGSNLPSKGLELNLGYSLGLGGKSFKTDDLADSVNKNDLPWFLQSGQSDAEKAKAESLKKEAESYGLNGLFTGQEKYIKLSQTQLLNQAKDIQLNKDGLNKFFSETGLTVGTDFSTNVKQAANQVRELDKQLFSLGQKRSKLGLLNTSNSKVQIAELDKQLMVLEKQRGVAAKEIVNIDAQAKEVGTFDPKTGELKSGWLKDTMDAIRDNKEMPLDVRMKLIADLKPMEDAIKLASQKIAKLPVDPLKEIYQTTISALRDFEVVYEKFLSTNKIGVANQQEALYSSGTNQGNLNQGLSFVALQEQEQQKDALSKLSAIRKRSFDNLNSITNFGKTDEQKKELDDLRKAIKDDDENLAKMGADIAKAKRDIRQSLIDQTKQVADYYRSAVREAQAVSIEFQKAQKTLENSRMQNKLREALIGAGDNIYTQFIEGIINIISQTSEIEKQQLEAKKQRIDYENNVQDIRLQAAELQRSLPGEIIPLDSSMADGFNLSLEEINGTVSTINSSVKGVASSLSNDVVDAAKKANAELDKLNQTIQNIDNSSNSWIEGFGSKFADLVKSLENGFDGVGAAIADMRLKTADWLASLGNAPVLAQNVVSGVQSAVSAVFGKEAGKQVEEGVKQVASNPIGAITNFLGANKNKILSPIQGTTVEDLLRYKPSYQQGFYGSRDRGTRQHSKIDFDSRAKAGQGAEIIASLPGTATARKWTGNSGGVFVNSLLPSGQKLTLEYGHLSLESIKKTFGGQLGKSIEVQAGQKLGNVIHDALSSGPHLDFGVRLNGKYVEPQKFLQDFMGGKYGGVANNAKQAPQLQTAQISRQQITRGGNDLTPQEYAKLTAQGKELYKLRRNPNILAIADGVARAEGTDFRKNSKNFGYGMLIGSENINDFSGHPFVEGGRGYRHNSSASGRYQMMDFNYSKSRVARQFGRGAKTDLEAIFNYNGKDNPGTFSPGLQDLYFIQSLKSRGVLDKVLGGQIDSSVLNKLAPHYASIQKGNARSAYGGQGTPQGQHGDFLRFVGDRNQFYANSKALDSTVMRGGTIQPNQMQQAVTQAGRLRLNTAAQQYQTNQINSNLSPEQIKNSQLQQTLERDKYILQARTGARAFDISTKERSFGTEKFVAEGLIPNMSNLQQYMVKMDELIMNLNKRESDLLNIIDNTPDPSKLTNIRAAFEKEMRPRFKDDPAGLASVMAANDAKLNNAVNDRNAAIKELQLLRNNRTGIIGAFQEDFRKKEGFRLSEQDISQQSKVIEHLQQQLQLVQKLEETDPLNPLVLSIPALQKNIESLSITRDQYQQLLDLQKRYYEGGGKGGNMSEAAFQKEFKAILNVNSVKKEGVDLNFNYADTVKRIDFATKELTKSQTIQASTMKSLQLDNERFAIENKNGMVSLVGLTNELTMKTNELTNAYKKQDLEIQGNTLLNPQEKLTERLKNIRNQQKEQSNAIAETTYKENLANLVTNPQVKFDAKNKREDLLGQTDFDIRQAGIDGLKSRGANQFLTNRMSRELGIEKEIERNNRAKEQMKIDIAKFNLDNPGLAIAADEIDKITASMDKLSQLNIEKVNGDFKTFGQTIDSIVQEQLISGLSSGFAELIQGTKSFGDVLNDLANNIINGVLNASLNALFSGLFGGGSGLFGGGGKGGGFLGGIFGFNKGGIVPNFADGGVIGAIGDALQRERQASGVKPVLAALTPGERVLTVRQNKRFEELQMEKVLNYAGGGVVGGSVPSMNFTAPSQSSNTNIDIGDINVSGDSSGASVDVPQLRNSIRSAVLAEIQKQQRPGGALNK